MQLITLRLRFSIVVPILGLIVLKEKNSEFFFTPHHCVVGHIIYIAFQWYFCHKFNKQHPTKHTLLLLIFVIRNLYIKEVNIMLEYCSLQLPVYFAGKFLRGKKCFILMELHKYFTTLLKE